MNHKHPPARPALRKWLLLCCGLIGGCIVPREYTNTQRQDCDHLPKAQITGWIEQIEDQCAALYQSNERMVYIQRKSLPKGTREGDYLLGGIPQPQITARARRETLHLLQTRRPLPRVFVIPGTPKQIAKELAPTRAKGTRKRTWKQFHKTREIRRKQHESTRFRRPPWRRLWRRKRKPWRTSATKR